ncbi:hypothetical protein Tco_1078488 [Tanacetum coccineum]|uniref:Uncharacterized protein n=1 Tax=Tanacetum coccineum TaxID=301880 RepID=A0ABQ5HP51_9ASTR
MGRGHTLETIDIEYECHTLGVKLLTKPKPNYYNRPISKSVNVNDEASTSQPKENKDLPASQPNNKGNNVGSIMDDSDSEEVENIFVEDNGKPMDDLVGDARKKVKASPKKTPRKTRIWLGRKADSPKINVVFSPETNVHYFDRDGMIFDDKGQTFEGVEHENAYSTNG